ncbi:hypothetical protein JCM10207_004132 [Rhodosporidiobolus poonsookiae]
MATHHGFLREFPFIRVDAFDGDPARVNPFTGKGPHFYLLSHAHTDHIVGLNSPYFAGKIYAHPLTKRLVLDAMEAADRVRHEEHGGGDDCKPRRKFENLRQAEKGVAKGKGKGRGRVQIVEIPYNSPIEVDGPNGARVSITALDANHCPGSCMFLIAGVPSSSSAPCAVLHTGDLRAEPWLLEALRKNPLVQPYLAPPPLPPSRNGKEREGEEGQGEKVQRRAGRTLDCIYLDTSSVLVDEELVPKDEATAALVELMAQYPPETRFFLNAWTWGYEDMLKAVHRAFDEEIHLDWFKHSIYASRAFRTHDPLLSTLGGTSLSPSPLPCTSTSSAAAPSPSLHAPPTAATGGEDTKPPHRFHACERRWRCDAAWHGGVGCYAWSKAWVPHLRGPKRLKVPSSGAQRPRGEKAGKEGGEEEEGGKVVFVNPAEMERWRWEEYREETWKRVGRYRDAQEREKEGKGKKRARLEDDEGEAELPGSLIVPLARHSTLPELQRLVALFQPRTIHPLTLASARNLSSLSAGPPAARKTKAAEAAYDYLALPGLFGACLAPGGEGRLRAEARAYRDELAAGPTAGGVASSPTEEDENREEELVEPRWVRDLARKGLNIEGGEGAVEEVLRWSRGVRGGERGKAGAEEQEGKGKEGKGKEKAEVLVLDTDEEDGAQEEEGEGEVVQPMQVDPPPSASASTTPTPLDPARVAAERARLSSPWLDAAPRPAPAEALALLPPAPIDSPPGAATARRSAFARHRTPEPSKIPATATASSSRGRALPKSVSWAASPSPRGPLAQVALSSPELGAPAALGLLLSPTAPSPSKRLRTSSSSSASSSSLSISAPHALAPLPTSSSLSALPPAAASASRPAQRPSLAHRDRRHAVIAALHRAWRGEIAAGGGRIEPFEEGDGRLQGRRALRVKGREGKEQGEGMPRRDERALREVQPQMTVAWTSPSSFRTVEASTSP